ncbi:putative ribonuclease H-like domain-containing protein [Tanacetum coccineum]
MRDGLGYDWSYVAQGEPTEFALMAYTLNSSGSDTELGLEFIEARLIVHQKNEVVYEEKIAVLEFEIKNKSNAITRLKNQLDETLTEKDDLKAKLEHVFDSRSSDGDDNQTNDRFKKDHGYYVVPPPLTGNYMPPLVDLFFAGLDDSVYRPITNKTSASVSQVEVSTSQTSNTSVEMHRVESVRPSGVIIEDWVSDDEDIFQSNDVQATDKPSFKRIEFTNARNESVKPKQAEKPRMITQNPRTLNEAARTILVDSLLPTVFWAEAVNTACYVLNRVLVTKPHNKTPYELIIGRPPSIRQGPNWLFDIDSLTISMNYQPFTTGNQTNKNAGPQETNGNTGLKKNINDGKSEEKNVFTQQYIVFPLWSSISSSNKSSDETDEDDTADDAAGEKPIQKPASKNKQALKNVLDKMMDQEKEAKEQSDAVRKEFGAQCNRQNLSGKTTRASSTNSFNTLLRDVAASFDSAVHRVHAVSFDAAVASIVSAACCAAAGYFVYCCCLLCSCCSSILLPQEDLSRNLELTESTPIVPADSLNSIPADNVPAGRSSSIPADYVSAGHVLVPADSDRIC